jgi:hypothetical protein
VKRKRQGRWRCTIADVKKAHWMLHTDPQKFERSERLKWIVATDAHRREIWISL